MTLRSLGVLLVLALLAAGGCGPDAPGVSWRVVFADDALRLRAVAVEATLLEGGCSSIDVVYEAELARDLAAPAPLPVRPGRFGFAARARDADCLWFARGCADVSLPAEGALVTVTIDEAPLEAQCATARCVEGTCGDQPDADADLDADADIDADADLDADADFDADADADADADEVDPCGGACLECETCVGGACVLVEDDAPCGDRGHCVDGACCGATLAGGVTVVDELEPCFVRVSEYWWDGAAGWDDHHYYTWAYDTAEADTIGRWMFAVDVEGRYLVEAYLEGTADSSRQAVYVIRAGHGPQRSTPVSQFGATGWVDVGTFDLAAGTGRSVSLPDNTGEARSLDRKILYDAIRFTLVPE